MCSTQEAGRWRVCPGCGRERRLAPGHAVVCDHNRWDSASWSMVACEGSGQPPPPLRAAAMPGPTLRPVGPGEDGRAA